MKYREEVGHVFNVTLREITSTMIFDAKAQGHKDLIIVFLAPANALEILRGEMIIGFL